MANVIKIKFEDTLRRIGYEEVFMLDIVKLREKICSLFGLNFDADFTLTYIDEEGDEVTLCDNDDVDELDCQSLDPIRMTVRLNPDNHAKSSLDVTSIENSTPVNSTQDQPSLQSLNSAISVILKFVHEQYHNELFMYLLDLIWQNNNMKEQNVTKIDEPSETSSIQSLNSAISVILKFVPEQHHNEFFMYLIDLIWQNNDMKEQDVTKIDEPSETLPDEDASDDSKTEVLQVKTEKKDVILADIDLNVPYSNSETVQLPVNGVDVIKGPFGMPSCPSETCIPQFESRTVHQNIICDGCEAHPITGPRFKSKLKDDFDLCLLCFEESGHDAADYIRMDHLTCSRKEPPVCNDQKDPEVVRSPKMDQKDEVCENISIGILEFEDAFFDAPSHKDLVTKNT